MNPSSRIRLWSASPTPLTADLRIDVVSLGKVVETSIGEGVEGLFIGGTCGEGPWLPNRERRRLVEAATAAARGRLEIAVQVSDNSIPRILDNIADAQAAGAACAVIAPPAIMLNFTAERCAAFFTDAAERSPLPVGIYDLGDRRQFGIPDQRLREIYLHPNVRLIKDSSGSTTRRAIALAARAEKPGLTLFNGDEFSCAEYLEAGYDGIMFGGAVAVTAQLRRIIALHIAGDSSSVRSAAEQMNRVLYGIYGGKSIACWLTGLKYYMVQRGLFSSYASFLGYPLTEECRGFIEAYVAETG